MKTFKHFVTEAGDYWHPDPEKDRQLGGPGANQRSRQDGKSPEDYSKKLKPGETYMDFHKTFTVEK